MFRSLFRKRGAMLDINLIRYDACLEVEKQKILPPILVYSFMS